MSKDTPLADGNNESEEDADFRVSRRASEDHNKDLLQEAQIQALGKNLVSRLAMLFKTVRIHSVQNEALRYSVKILVEAANALFTRLGDYTLRGDVDSVFVNDYRNPTGCAALGQHRPPPQGAFLPRGRRNQFHRAADPFRCSFAHPDDSRQPGRSIWRRAHKY